MKQNSSKKSVLWKTICSAVLIFSLCVGLFPGTGKAAGTYLIKVNKQASCVTIYKTDANGEYQPVKALICSAGWATKPGTYSLGEKMRWHVLDGPCYGQYCTRIYGGVLFHSVWYTGQNNPSTLSVSSYNKLGSLASHGCVRLTVAGAKWIYDNVPSGTKVVIYNSSNPGPLGKPKSIQLPYSVSWDPTDVWSKGNPWNKKKPKITGAKNQTIEYNTTFNVKKGVKATNTTGFDATSRIKVSIRYEGQTVKKVDTANPGVYRVTYKVKDEIGRKASKTVKIKVTGRKTTPKISGVENLYVRKKSQLTKSYALKNVTVKQGSKKLADKYIKVQFKKIRKDVYKVIYLAQNASEPVKATVKAYVDNKAPVISNVKDGEIYTISSDQKVNEEYVRTWIKVSDNVTALTVKDVAVTIHESDANTYKVVYKVKDQAGNETKVTVHFVRNTATLPATGQAIASN